MSTSSKEGTKYNILHIVHALNIGGMEKWIVKFCIWLKQNGHACSVACLKEEGKLAPLLQEEGVKVTRIKLMPKISSLYPLGLFRHIRTVSPDIIHAHSGVWRKASVAARLAGVPLVYTEHGIPHQLDKDTERRMRIALRYTQRVIAVSQEVYDKLSNFFGCETDKIELVINGTEDFLSCGSSAIEQESWAVEGKRVIGMVARFEYPKDHLTLLHAVAEVHSRLPNVYLVLVGEGPDLPKVRQLAIQLGMQKYTWVLGYRADVAAILRRLDVFVLSSLSEGTPLAVVEAMSAARPIVATDVGGNSLLLDGGRCGILVPPRDPHALAEAILELLTNREKAQELARNARQRFLEHFTIDAMGRRYLEVYERAMEEFRQRC